MTQKETAYFGAAEIATNPDSLSLDGKINAAVTERTSEPAEPATEALIGLAKNWNGGAGLFANHQDRVLEALDAAYPLHLRLLDQDPQDLEAATKIEHFPGRERRI